MTEPPGGFRTPSDPAEHVVEVLMEEGVTHVVTVPDNTSAPILAALKRRAAGSGSASSEGRPEAGGPRPLLATREGEAMGLAAGLWMGGAFPCVLIQNTGLLESGDGLRGTLTRMGAPVVLLVTCRGYEKARDAGLLPAAGIVDPGILVRNDLDSVAHMTEPTLQAWGIPFHYMTDPADSSPLRRAFSHAREDGRPVAVLLDTTF